MFKTVVLAVRHEDEREAISSMLIEQGVTVYEAQTGQDAICLVEDYHCDAMVTDIQLPDMHAWTMLNKLREMKQLAAIPLIVLSDERAAAPLSNVTLVVRPVALASLRQIIKQLAATA